MGGRFKIFWGGGSVFVDMQIFFIHLGPSWPTRKKSGIATETTSGDEI